MNQTVDWSRVKALFAQVHDVPFDRRDAWLAEHSGGDAALLAEVRSLLAAQAGSMSASDFLSGGGARLAVPLLAADAIAEAFPTGTVIGAYRVLRLLGEGGMGRVFLAERADGQFQQQVALKLIRGEFATPELRQRFLRERDILARLANPHIAQLHDGGVSADGIPYFTLEFVDGKPITRWCDERRLGIRERIALLLKVCDAVQYAHRNLIVHRDLKPSNILVTDDGVPKLLDFGIAKPLDADSAAAEVTATGSRPMTREYAAPEQVLGEPVTTATDVYALGLLLYLLLCGQMPYRRAALGQSSLLKAILEEAPESLDRALERTAAHGDTNEAAADAASTGSATATDAAALAATRGTSPGTLKRALRGDLERVVQRALAKNPEARYATVGALADDLRSYLDGRALSGGTRTYRLRKFVARHWLPLAAASILLLVIVGGALALAAQARQMQQEARRTAAVKDFLLELFRNANPNNVKGKQITLRDVVDRGVQRLETIPPDQPALRAELETTLGTIYFQLGLYQEAADLHEHAFAAIKSVPEDTPLAARAERFEATERASLGDNARAQELADDAIQRLRALSQPPKQDLAEAYATAGWVAGRRKDSTRANELSEAAFALASQPPTDDEILFRAFKQKSMAARLANDDTSAIDYAQRALALAVKLNGHDDQESIESERALGTLMNAAGRFVDAQPHLQASFDSSLRVFGEANGRTLRASEVLSINEMYMGRVADAQAHLGRMLAIAEAKDPPDEKTLAEIRLNYAESLVDFGKPDLVESLLIATRDFLRQHAGSDPEEMAETLSTLGYAHMLAGKLDVAESEQREALETLTANHDENTTTELTRLSNVLVLRGDVAAALTCGQQARDTALKASGERSHDTAFAHFRYGAALVAAGQMAAAETELRAALHSYTLLDPPEGMHPWSAGARLALAQLLMSQSAKRDEALRLAQQASSVYEQFLGAKDPRVLAARQTVAELKTAH